MERKEVVKTEKNKPQKKGLRSFHVESLEQFIDLYPALFSEKKLPEWRKLFKDNAIIIKVDDSREAKIFSIAEVMPEQQEYAEENDFFEEKWLNVRVSQHGNIAFITADYVLTVDTEVRKGVDAATLVYDREGWKMISLAYEQTEYIQL